MGTLASPGGYALEDLCEALIREYLHRKGLRETLSVLDKEKPRTARSISDKKVLRTELGLSKAAKDFKRANPSAEHLPAYLELLATVQIANPERASRNPEAGARGHDSKQKYLEKRPSTAPRSLGSSQMAPPGSRLNDIRARTQGGQAGDVWSSLMDATQEPASNRISDATTPPYGGTASGSGAAFPIVDDSPPPGPQSSLQASRAPSRAPIGRTALQSPDLFSSVSHGPLDRAGARELGARGGATSGGRPSGRGPGGGSTDLLVQDLDEDFDAMGVSDAFGVAGTSGLSSSRAPASRGGSQSGVTAHVRRGQSFLEGAAPLSVEEIRALKDAVFGTCGGDPSDTWKQGFYFSTVPTLGFGLVQSQGGPCGVLAAVQARMLAGMWDRTGRFDLDPSTETREELLVNALSDMVWEARRGATKQALVVVCKAGAMAGMRTSGFWASARKVGCDTRAAVISTMRSCLEQYMEERGFGVVLFMLSVVLSRGTEQISADMDDGTTTMVTRHNYCSQDLVNLLLVGRACTNCFDKDRDLDGMLLKGIHRRGKVGFLMLFEWYLNAEVGDFLKNPECPVWVICSESHYTVLFTDEAGRASRMECPFRLFYYDQLASQEKVIELTIKESATGGHTGRAERSPGGRGGSGEWGEPPIEFVLETKWPRIQVDWNGSEPIL